MYTRIHQEILSRILEIKMREITKVKLFTANHLNMEEQLHCSPDFISDSLQIIMLKCISVTDIIKNVSHTKNSCSSCDQEESSLRTPEAIVSVSPENLEVILWNRRA